MTIYVHLRSEIPRQFEVRGVYLKIRLALGLPHSNGRQRNQCQNDSKQNAPTRKAYTTISLRRLLKHRRLQLCRHVWFRWPLFHWSPLRRLLLQHLRRLEKVDT